MLRTAGLLAPPRRAWSAGFDRGISPPFQFVAAQLLGGWDLTETRLSRASPTRLLWTHTEVRTPAGLRRLGLNSPAVSGVAAVRPNPEARRAPALLPRGHGETEENAGSRAESAESDETLPEFPRFGRFPRCSWHQPSPTPR